MKRHYGLITLLLTIISCGTGGVYPSDPSAGTGGSGIADGATNVSITGPFTMDFSEAIDTGTVTIDTFYIAQVQSTTCDIANRIDGFVECSSSTECTFTPAGNLSYSTQYAICLTSGIRYANGLPFEGLTITFTTEEASQTCTAPTCADIHAAILANNATGIRPAAPFASTALPGFTCPSGATPTYSMTDLPDWLAFEPSTRALGLNGVETVPADATSGYTATYTATINSVASSVSCLLNDMDGDTMTDYLEYKYGEVPLVNPAYGWIWLDPATDLVYRPKASGVRTVPTGITRPTKGLNLNDATDAALDFDGDGLTNLEETSAGTNIFVAASDGTFSNVQTLTGIGGPSPSFVATGDFDDDGDLDLAVGIEGNYRIAVFLGSGDGTFGGAVNYIPVADKKTRGIVAADFNRDGNLDLAMATEGENSVSVALGNGDGTFSNGTDYPSGQWTVVLTTGDFNGDGIPDLAATNMADNSVSVLIGDGNGGFSNTPDIPAGANPIGIIAGDFNNDGKLDVATADSAIMVPGGSSGISVLLGNGDGTFSLSIDTPCGTTALTLTAGDFNNDDKLDAAVADAGASNVIVLLGNGDGTFAGTTNYPVGTGPWVVNTGDMDGDGKLDLVASNTQETTISILPGRGDGTFSEKVDYAVGAGPLGLAVGDFNNDGKLDLAVVNNEDDTVSILLNQ